VRRHRTHDGRLPRLDPPWRQHRRRRRVRAAVFLNLLNLLLQEHSIAGTFGYASEFEEARDLIVSRAIDVSPLISRVVSLDELPTAFEHLTSDRNRDQKVLVRPNG
jgi:threonine dehydrogenase-like Zn-dependent dehydrogenase